MAELSERKPVESWLTDWDHFDPTYLADPDAVWAELRGQCPVAHSDRYGGVNVLSRWNEVYEAIHDPARFTSRRLIINEIPTERRGVNLPPINLDPPDHNDRRRALLPFFAPPAIKKWEEPIRQICRRELDRLAGRTEVDLAEDYAQVIPAELTAIMLGVPLEDVPLFREWLHDLLEVGPTNPDVMRATTATMMEYMAKLAKERRQHRGDDVVSFLLETEFEDGPITDDELTRMIYLFLIAGIDTTWSSIGSSLMHLARNPEDRHRLAADPSLIPMAVEEFLRFYPPVWVARIATEDTELGGCPVAEGEWVALGLPSINRDPDMFEDPDEVHIDRKVNRHAAFGLGVHRCLGSNLARMEMVIALEEWMARFPDFEIADESRVTFAAGQVRGPRTVPARILAQ